MKGKHLMNTTEETFSKQVPIALAAIGQHMHEHQLPIPLAIDIHVKDQLITVRLIGTQVGSHTAWLRTLAIDSETNELVAGFADQQRTSWMVRLPDLGVRFELVAYRPVPFLTAVPA